MRNVLIIVFSLIQFVSSYCFANENINFDIKGKFICSGSKCLGLDFSIRYPNDWQVLETDRPHVAGKIFSENGKGLEGLIITIFKDKRFDELSLESIAKSNMTKNSKLISYTENLNIDNCKSSSLIFESEDKSLDLILNSKNVVYVFKYEQYTICLLFMVADKNINKQRMLRKFDDYLPLFKKMTMSFVINSQYKK